MTLCWVFNASIGSADGLGLCRVSMAPRGLLMGSSMGRLPASGALWCGVEGSSSKAFRLWLRPQEQAYILVFFFSLGRGLEI